ncbi:hypothetical protein [Candidatus Amarolinea dominans]|uniref:hypothetical protein n=1 Tax=Candidatus Amarolinea dominans TaxID=3140696 RepID=UPI001D7C2AC2|nr:hypothetical protein [Anaerolineae bacterium]
MRSWSCRTGSDVEAALAGLAHVRTVEPLQTADAFPAYRIVGTDASDTICARPSMTWPASATGPCVNCAATCAR